MIKSLILLLFATSISIVSFAQSAPPSANEIMQKAYGKANAENKNVFIIFHASWCVWCKKMDAAMNDATCKKFFDENYVVEHLTIMEVADKKNLENPGAEEMFKKYAPENPGIPFWLIFDGKTQKLIADAKMPDGSNSGCPAAVNEVEHFISVIKKSSKIDEVTAKAVYDRFRKNEITK